MSSFVPRSNKMAVAIDFKAFKEGKVYVHMRGACSGCPSSMQTLKGGIEQLLTSKIDAITEVVALGYNARL